MPCRFDMARVKQIDMCYRRAVSGEWERFYGELGILAWEWVLSSQGLEWPNGSGRGYIVSHGDWV